MTPLKKITIAEVMSENILTISPREKILDACKKMSKLNIGSAIVLNNTIAGIITERDILHHLALSGDNSSGAPVSSIMSKNILCIDINESLELAGNLMGEHNFRHLPVVKDKQVVGILSARDIFKAFHGQDTIKIKQLEAIKAMAVTYAHEINNPLMIITSSIKKLKKEFEHDKLDLADTNVLRITEVIKKIMDLKAVHISEYSQNTTMVKLEKE